MQEKEYKKKQEGKKTKVTKLTVNILEKSTMKQKNLKYDYQRHKLINEGTEEGEADYIDKEYDNQLEQFGYNQN
uniref:Uncharacterized protein n=1 Tax=Romanomermis culicivorax TaxID=13658 RepID=A0A915J9R5_ROMCU